MIKNIFLTAFRNLTKDKFHVLVSISGLSIGFSISFILIIWISGELNFDKFHKNYEKTYRLIRIEQNDISVNKFSTSFANNIENQIPEVKYSACIMNHSETVLWHEQEKLNCKPASVNKDFFNVFNFPIKYGNIEKAFNNSKGTIITSKLSKKLFGDKNPVGKVIYSTYNRDYIIEAVLKPLPVNTHLVFDIIFPEDYSYTGNRDFYSVYMQVHNNEINFKELKIKISSLFQESRKVDDKVALQPLSDIYLYSGFLKSLDCNKAGNITILRIYFFVIILILSVTVFNYINLSTAKGIRRAKEIAVRKIAGAKRKNLIFQFLSEAILFTVIAMIAGCIFVGLSLSLFSGLLRENLLLSIKTNIVIYFIAGGIVVGFISGLYPAFYLSRLNVIKAFRGGVVNAGMKTRKVIAIFQVTTSLVVILFSVIVYSQLNYIKNKNIGYEKDNIIQVPLNKFYLSSRIKNELLKIPEVENVSVSANPPTFFSNKTEVKLNNENKYIPFTINPVDERYLDFFSIQLLEGTQFYSIDESIPNATNSCLVNEAAIHDLGMDDPISKTIKCKNNSQYKIIGVFKDFHFKPLSYKIGPLMLIQHTEGYFYVFVKIRQGYTNKVLKKIEKCYYLVYGENDLFNYSFLNENIDSFYQKETMMARNFACFAIICFLISCIGVIGLISYMAKMREKEVAIRKTFGAFGRDIMVMYNKYFLGIFLISLSISIPIIIYYADKWLDGFAYRGSINYLVLISVIIGVALFLIGIILIRLIKIVNQKPFDILQNV